MSAQSIAPSISVGHGLDAMHGRTDGRTHGDRMSPTEETSPSVTRALACADSPAEPSTACIRRPSTTWTTCPCPTCEVDRYRTQKLHRMGRIPSGDGAAAYARIREWVLAGYSDQWITTACGVPTRFGDGIVREVRAGRVRKIGHVRAAQILAADIRNGSAGRAPVLGARRRLRALARLGWDGETLSQRTGVPVATLTAIRGRKDTVRIAARTWQAVRAVYDELCMTPGPNHWAAQQATRKGWPPPLAWDDIDDPTASPATETSRRPPSGGRWGHEVVEDVQDILAWDPAATEEQIATRLGVARGSVAAALGRAGREDLLVRLNRNAELSGANVTRRTA